MKTGAPSANYRSVANGEATAKKKLNWFDNVEPRPHPWQGLTWITPMLAVPNVQKALEFDGKVFGLVCIFELPDDQGKTVFARLRYRGTNITLYQEQTPYLPLASPATSDAAPPFMFYL